jgi:hypothetical protein
LGCFHIKGIDGITYIAIFQEGFPDHIAAECLDEFSEGYQRCSAKWFEKRKQAAQHACTGAIFAKYSSLEVDSAAWILMNDTDETCRLEYSKSVRRLVDEVKKLEDKMHHNIVQQLQNIDQAEHLQALSEDCLEKAKVFRKNAKKVKCRQRRRSYAVTAKGVAFFATAGGVVGFLAGGPGSALLFTSMSSVAGAEAIEASIMALIFGASYLAAESKIKDWTWNQRILFL